MQNCLGCPETALAKHTRDLERSNRELEDFAYVASHDLQEPLRKIQAFGDRLQSQCSDEMSERGSDYLARMRSAATRMHTLINDLLHFSRVTTHARPFEVTDMDVIVRGVLTDLEFRVGETGAQIDVGTLPVIDADAIQMRQLMQNLIGNALKFHKPDQPPNVKITARRMDAALVGREPMEMWEISVSDDGIGFDEKHTSRIFTVFQRLHTREQHAGTGVGLAICRRIVERHGGDARAESQEGQGATFRVTLPTRHPADSATEGLDG